MVEPIISYTSGVFGPYSRAEGTQCPGALHTPEVTSQQLGVIPNRRQKNNTVSHPHVTAPSILFVHRLGSCQLWFSLEKPLYCKSWISPHPNKGGSTVLRVQKYRIWQLHLLGELHHIKVSL